MRQDLKRYDSQEIRRKCKCPLENRKQRELGAGIAFREYESRMRAGHATNPIQSENSKISLLKLFNDP